MREKILETMHQLLEANPKRGRPKDIDETVERIFLAVNAEIKGSELGRFIGENLDELVSYVIQIKTREVLNQLSASENNLFEK